MTLADKTLPDTAAPSSAAPAPLAPGDIPVGGANPDGGKATNVLALDRSTFLYKLTVATFCLLVAVLGLSLLREFKAILQPLFIAVFLCYIILPVHHWLVQHGIPSLFAYIVMLLMILGVMLALGTLVYANVQDFLQNKLPDYEQRLDKTVRELAHKYDWDLPKEGSVFQGLSLSQFDVQGMIGTFRDFFTALAVTFIYLVFIIADLANFPRRVSLAFGETQGRRVMDIVGAINYAIAEYLSVKAFVSIAAAAFSMLVLAIFRIDFFVTLGILIGLFNFIPYIGSLVAIVPPIALSFLQLETWQAFVVTALLIGIQQICGILEPRIAGQKLGVSPLLILLSLAFWGLVWGIVGMILAVPLLMTMKIIFDSINETKPLATLMSNQ